MELDLEDNTVFFENIELHNLLLILCVFSIEFIIYPSLKNESKSYYVNGNDSFQDKKIMLEKDIKTKTFGPQS